MVSTGWASTVKQQDLIAHCSSQVYNTILLSPEETGGKKRKKFCTLMHVFPMRMAMMKVTAQTCRMLSICVHLQVMLTVQLCSQRCRAKKHPETTTTTKCGGGEGCQSMPSLSTWLRTDESSGACKLMSFQMQKDCQGMPTSTTMPYWPRHPHNYSKHKV